MEVKQITDHNSQGLISVKLDVKNRHGAKFEGITSLHEIALEASFGVAMAAISRQLCRRLARTSHYADTNLPLLKRATFPLSPLLL